MAAGARDVIGILSTALPPMLRTSLARNTLTLVSGTIASQALLFLASPLLSRVFSLPDFGDLANYNAWVSILALLSSLRYEHAVIIAPGRRATNRLVALTTALTVAFAGVFFLLAALIAAIPVREGYLRELQRIVWLVPAGVLAVCATSLLIQLDVRGGRFKRLAMVNTLQVISTVALQLTLGLAQVSHALILGTLAGYALAALALSWFFFRRHRWQHIARELNLAQLRATAVEHRNFPRYTLGADALNVAVQNFIPVFVLALFGPAIAGLYAFTMRVVRTPLLVISTSITSALRKEAADHLREHGDLVRLVAPTVRHLLAIGLVPLLILLIAAPPLFILVFGTQWAEAGRLAQILSPAMFVEFVAFPLGVVFLVTNRQRYSLWLQSAGFTLLVSALVIGSRLSRQFELTAMLVAIALVMVNVATIALAFRAARRNGSAIATVARATDMGVIPGHTQP